MSTPGKGTGVQELCVCMHVHVCLHTHQLQSEGGLLKRKERTEGEGQRVALKRFESRSLLTRFFSLDSCLTSSGQLAVRGEGEQATSISKTYINVYTIRKTNKHKQKKIGRRDLAFVFGKTLFCSYG